jgi:hypothetical protein
MVVAEYIDVFTLPSYQLLDWVEAMTMTTSYLDLVAEKATGRVTDEVRREIGGLVSEGGLITEPAQLRTYECDGLTGFRVVPALVVLPTSTHEVAAVVRVCAREHIPFVARGAGTGLSGGALPIADGVVIGLARMRKILSVDAENQRAVVQPGVTNLGISNAVAPRNMYFAPDPSSQVVCTIGGNVAENSGGAHCLKYGFTTNHVLGLTMVCADGSVVTLGGDSLDQVGPDLRASSRRLSSGCCASLRRSARWSPTSPTWSMRGTRSATSSRTASFLPRLRCWTCWRSKRVRKRPAPDTRSARPPR